MENSLSSGSLEKNFNEVGWNTAWILIRGFGIWGGWKISCNRVKFNSCFDYREYKKLSKFQRIWEMNNTIWDSWFLNFVKHDFTSLKLISQLRQLCYNNHCTAVTWKFVSQSKNSIRVYFSGRSTICLCQHVKLCILTKVSLLTSQFAQFTLTALMDNKLQISITCWTMPTTFENW